jgi:hypothetical protein
MDYKPLEFFKDWSNYLLVTTVAALGWVTTEKPSFSTSELHFLCVWSFALSTLFAIFTLALIPLVAEQRQDGQSMYEVRAEFSLLAPFSLRLKTVCFPQHVLFILGIVLYAVGTA